MSLSQTTEVAYPEFDAGRVEFPRPKGGALDQDEEFCLVHFENEDEPRRMRFHDYDEIYAVRGLYEYLFYDKLRCASPKVICDLLKEQVEIEGDSMEDLSVLDVGAGNGMVGEQLALHGCGAVTGLDIIPEAKEATERDRPGVYEDYMVEDLMDLSDEAQIDLTEKGLNGLTTVAALGYGDIPVRAFANAFNFVSSPGWIAFNIKDGFLNEQKDETGFCRLIRRIIQEGILEIRAQKLYVHRLSIRGEPLRYVAIAGRKTADIPESMID